METEDMKKARSKQKPRLTGKMKALVYSIMGVLTIATAVAVWISLVTSSGSFSLTSDGTPLTLTTDFGNVVMDASNGDDVQNITFVVNNQDGTLNADIVTNITKTDIPDGCDYNWENDVNITMYFNGVVISEDDNQDFVSGDNTIMAVAQARRFGCPQVINLTTEVTSVPV